MTCHISSDFFTSICEELRYDGALNGDKSHNMRLYTTERKLCGTLRILSLVFLLIYAVHQYID